MSIFTCNNCYYCRTDICNTGEGVCLRFKNRRTIDPENKACPFGEEIVITTPMSHKCESSIISTIDEEAEYRHAEKEYYETCSKIFYRLEEYNNRLLKLEEMHNEHFKNDL